MRFNRNIFNKIYLDVYYKYYININYEELKVNVKQLFKKVIK